MMRVWRSYVALFFAIIKAFRSPRIKALLLVCLMIAVGQAFVFTHVEGWRFLDALYFSVVSMATVGYGDLVPHTGLGKLSAMAFLLIGVGIFVLTVSSIAQVILHELSLSESHDKPQLSKRPDSE